MDDRARFEAFAGLATEQRNPRTLDLDTLDVPGILARISAEDRTVPDAVARELPYVARAVELVVESFRRGGRLLYVGSGTSGRLGVLDASECPPTFRTPPEMVQGIIAGGPSALSKAVEGAEDDAQAGVGAIVSRKITARDVVVGITASGTAPFVWGALREARKRRATSILICFNPFLAIPARLRPTIVIAPNLGPELLAGSTRLKAGTATKLILNL